MSALFQPFSFTSARATVTLPNRIVIAPMCQYQAVNGQATDWHLMHWANLLNGGAGLLTIEATAVTPQGRISPACLGLWDDATEAALGRTLARARALAPHVPVSIQLAHAGRKASSALPWQGAQLLSPEQGGWPTVAPSAVPHLPQETPPSALDDAGIAGIRQAFVDAAQRAQRLGIEVVELHAAHGYLLHEFLSPLSNIRTDAYGGSLANRMRMVLEVFSAMRAAFDGVLGIRISASDWAEGGWDLPSSVALAQALKPLGCDFIHVSSGGLSHQQKIALGPNYQVPFAQTIRAESGLVTMAVGLITDALQAETILQQGQADLVALARAFLYNPRWGWHAAAALGGQVQAFPAYWRCLPREAASVFSGAAVGQR
ncbi:NADH:flavin oxidoreductase/NADH oxidase [Curvibacter sp. CHRR-16]|uniref:NADH:flavin oxidoreductase/NADH oxidase n=1 Tax=Curvibacter sp. CHRR-16 TaxID=2835872 RepID=UPI001BDA2268|nr:NADH:flavin oxidoreductase/NADH oxidase [Curvibacter sp. CHRR-16]MBT0570357.1 NADH:flavin oxidoreductase/NADH oxidase [Curvibacter sp. CHRR-16]